MFHTIRLLLMTIIVPSFASAMSGTVYDQNNAPKQGVVVSLLSTGVIDTTDASGSWTSGGTTGIKAGLRSSGISQIVWHGNSIRFSLQSAGKVRINILDSRGASIGTGFCKTLDAGEHNIPLMHSNSTIFTYLHIRTTQGCAVIPVLKGLSTSGSWDNSLNTTTKKSGTSLQATDSLCYSWEGTILIKKLITTSSNNTGIVQFLTIPPYKGIPWNDTIPYGLLQDERDGKIYRTVTIGSQTWMAQNLNYGTLVSGSEDQDNTNGEKYCYKDGVARCDTFGGLYQWSNAVALTAEYNSKSASEKITSAHRGICPSGWHIPTSGEWSTLKKYADSFVNNDSMSAQTLKSTTSWATDMGWGPGTDDLGFRAIAGGGRYYEGYNSSGSGSESFFRWCCRFRGMFWTSSEVNDTSACYEDISDDKTSLTRMSAPKSYGFCLRCIKD